MTTSLLFGLFCLALTSLGPQRVWQPGNEPQPPNGHPGFGRELHLVADQDGDGIRELIIVDSSRDAGDAYRDGIYVYSPGAERCLRRIQPRSQILQFGRATACVPEDSSGGFDLVYLGWRVDSGVRKERLTALSTESSAELGHWDLRPQPSSFRCWPLRVGYLDAGPGDETLFVLSSMLRDPVEGSGDGIGNVFCSRVVALPSGRVVREVQGVPLCVIDLDLDGIADLLAGEDRITVRSGMDGSRLLSWENPVLPADEFEGYSYSPFADVDGDGRREVLQTVEWGAYGFGDYEALDGCVRLRSGKDGTVLWETERTSCTGVMWVRAIAVRDRTGDGVPEVVATYSSDVTTFGECPGWRLYDGATGETLRQYPWEGRLRNRALVKGYDLLEIDDLDGDGSPEIAIGLAGFPLQDNRSGEVAIFSLDKGLLKRVHRHELDAQLARDADTPNRPR